MYKRFKVFFTIAAVAAGALFMIGCKTKYVVVEQTHTDTTYITRQQRDSIWLHDSVYLHEWTIADTVYLLQERWHTQYKEHVIHDTTYVSKTDSVPIPYPVEAQMTIWQRTKIRFGGIAICACAAIITILLFHFYRKLRP